MILRAATLHKLSKHTTKAKASEVITALQKGTYNADDYTVPF